MKGMETESGGPVMPRSKSRARVKSSISSGRSRWAMPGGATVALMSRSWSHAAVRAPRFVATSPCRGLSVCRATKTPPTSTRGPASGWPRCTAPTRIPMATAKAAGSKALRTTRAHQVRARARPALTMAPNSSCHSADRRRRPSAPIPALGIRGLTGDSLSRPFRGASGGGAADPLSMFTQDPAAGPALSWTDELLGSSAGKLRPVLLRGPARELVEQCADPAQVARFLDQLVEERPETAEHLAQDEDLAAALIAVVAASRSLSRLCLTEPAALDVLADLDRRVPIEAADRARLVRWERLELLRIAARDLLGLDGLEAVGADLADLADGVLGAAFRLAQSDGGGDGTPARLAVIAMGKLGARELNYASDIDVLFVSEGEGDTRWARRVTDVARACFRVDAGLRPEGGAGPLARSLASYQAYWDRWARAWELQALIKARAVAGDGELGREFVAAAAERVWSRPFGLEVLRELRSMKARAEGEVARRGLTTREVKRGPGGIRDVEFSVQLLQLVHGRHDPALRVPATLPALAELATSGYVAEDDAATMAEAYRFLRTVEHRLQLVEEQQVHSVPASRETRTHLARVMGYRDEPKTSAVDHFDDDLQAHQGAVR